MQSRSQAARHVQRAARLLKSFQDTFQDRAFAAKGKGGSGGPHCLAVGNKTKALLLNGQLARLTVLAQLILPAGATHFASLQKQQFGQLKKSFCQLAKHIVPAGKFILPAGKPHLASCQNSFCQLAELTFPAGEFTKTHFPSLQKLILPACKNAMLESHFASWRNSFCELANHLSQLAKLAGKLILPAGTIDFAIWQFHFASWQNSFYQMATGNLQAGFIYQLAKVYQAEPLPLNSAAAAGNQRP